MIVSQNNSSGVYCQSAGEYTSRGDFQFFLVPLAQFLFGYEKPGCVGEESPHRFMTTSAAQRYQISMKALVVHIDLCPYRFLSIAIPDQLPDRQEAIEPAFTIESALPKFCFRRGTNASQGAELLKQPRSQVFRVVDQRRKEVS